MCACVSFVLLTLSLSLGRSESSSPLGSGYGQDGSSAESDDKPESHPLYDPSLACLPPEMHTPTNNCSSGLWRNKTSCKCGDVLRGVIQCNNYNKTRISVLQCYCLHNDTTGLTVGSCLYGCFTNHRQNHSNLYTLYHSVQDLNFPCEDASRSGPLCGQCNSTDEGVPAYSFSLKCRKCTFSWKNIVIYIALAYGPLTVFFIIIVVFTVSVNSAPLHGYIYVAQMIATSIALRILQTMRETQKANSLQTGAFTFGATVYGFWNLDFFRFNSHFHCIHPSLSTLTVIMLDYLIAVYPIVIIVVLYGIVMLHGRGYRVLVRLWKPFTFCFVRFRQKLDIRTTLVDAFGTFFSLSYVKFLSTTVDLMTPAPMWDEAGNHVHSRMYYDGRLFFMQGKHLPYAVISLTCFALFNALPLLFLLLYPRRCFQRRIPTSLRRILHPFMDTLLGIYRDGSDGGVDCRFFIVVYPISRIAVLSMFMLVRNSFAFMLITFVTTITAMLVAVLKPYKSTAYNTVDTILVTTLALIYAGLASFFFASSVSSQQLPFSRLLLIVPIPLPFLYACGLVLYKMFTVCKLQRKMVRILQCTILCFGRLYLYFAERRNQGGEMEAFPSLNERTLLITGTD